MPPRPAVFAHVVDLSPAEPAQSRMRRLGAIAREQERPTTGKGIDSRVLPHGPLPHHGYDLLQIPFLYGRIEAPADINPATRASMLGCRGPVNPFWKPSRVRAGPGS